MFDFVITVDKFTEENYNNFSTAEDMSPYSAENQLKLTKALVILHIKPSTFHSYCTSGKYDRVCIQIHYIHNYDLKIDFLLLYIIYSSSKKNLQYRQRNS